MFEKLKEAFRFLIVGGANFLFTLLIYELLLLVAQPIILVLHFLVSRLGTAYAAAYWRYVAAAREELALVRRDESGHIAAACAVSLEPASPTRRLAPKTPFLHIRRLCREWNIRGEWHSLPRSNQTAWPLAGRNTR